MDAAVTIEVKDAKRGWIPAVRVARDDVRDTLRDLRAKGHSVRVGH